MSYNDTYGYDLEFLNKRSSYKMKTVNKSIKATANVSFTATVGFEELPLLYLLDCAFICRSLLQPK
jgi:hypothetical protein